VVVNDQCQPTCLPLLLSFSLLSFVTPPHPLVLRWPQCIVFREDRRSPTVKC
jgi:hypothetical protein